MHVKKSNKTQQECYEEISFSGLHGKAIKNLEIEKAKPITVEMKSFSSLKFYPDLKELKMLLPASLTEAEVKAKFCRRMRL